MTGKLVEPVDCNLSNKVNNLIELNRLCFSQKEGDFNEIIDKFASEFTEILNEEKDESVMLTVSMTDSQYKLCNFCLTVRV